MNMTDKNNLKIICLDFDGVVVDSNSIKSEAFIEIFEPYQDKIIEIKKFQQKNESLSRFIKFEHIAKNILMLEMPEKIISEWLKIYSNLTIEKVSRCNEINGALDFINYFKKLVPIYLISATPLDDLNIIINKRGYSDLFKKIYGSPLKKQDALKEIINSEHINHTDIIFIGDSQSDLIAANEVNICFYVFNSGRKFENFVNYNNFEALKQKINEDYYFY
jgi:phosphoglycolate phosphatase-like HAD superfamily hydrolase